MCSMQLESGDGMGCRTFTDAVRHVGVLISLLTIPDCWDSGVAEKC